MLETPSTLPISNVLSRQQEWDVLQRVVTSEPQEKLPESNLSALNLKLPPLTRTRLTVTLEDNLVLPG